MKLFLAKNSGIKTDSIYKSILLFLFLFTLVVSVSVAAVYLTEYAHLLLAGLILIGLIFFVFRRPFYSFPLFIISLPFEAAFVIEDGFTIRLSYILFIITILGLFFSGRKLYLKSPLNIPIFIFLGIYTLSLLMTIFASPPAVEFGETVGYRATQLRSIIQLLFLFFFASAYFLTLHFCSDKEKLGKVLKVYIGIALLISTYGIYQFFANKFGLPFVDITSAISTRGVGYGVAYYADPALFRPHATFQEPLNFGHYILSIFPLVLILYIFKDNSSKNNLLIKPNLFLIFIFATALLLTKSGGAWVGFTVAILLTLLLIKRKHKLKLIGLLVFAVIFFSILILPFISDQYRNVGEFITFRFSLEQLSQQPRLLSIPFIIDLWQRYPILGVGIGNYGLYAASHFSSPVIVSALGIFQQALVETGILGFLALLLLIFTYYWIIIHTLKKVKGTHWYPYCLGFLASFTAMVIQYLTFGDRFNLYFWVFMGISIGAVKLINKKEEK